MYWSVRFVWSTYRNPCSIPPEQGHFYCQKCYTPQEEDYAVPMSLGGLQAIRHIVLTEPERLFQFRLGAETQQAVNQFSEILCSLPTGLPTTDPAILQTAAIHTTTPSPSVINNGQMTNCFPKTRRHL